VKIYVNGRFLTQDVTGVQRYAIELTKALVASGADVTVLVPKDVRWSPLTDLLPLEVCGRLTGHAWEQLELPRHSRGGWLLSLCNTGPVLKRRHGVVIHDAAVFTFPQAYSFAFRWWYRMLLPLLGRTARRVFTVSDFSRTELVQKCKVPPRKVVVTSEGGDHVEAAPADRTVLEQHDLVRRPYVLAVSSMNPTKNFARLVEAVGRLDRDGFDVVFAGGSNSRVFQDAALGTSAVKRLGYVSDAELVALYQHATCFVTPSVYEGFGLPALEAMTLGCPVVAARAASLPEVCGDAAEYVDPHDAAHIAVGIARVMSDPVRRTAMSERGRRQATRFRWAAAAERVLTALD
jgi:glycosyltransferase involved in cell wall biosynthesis